MSNQSVSDYPNLLEMRLNQVHVENVEAIFDNISEAEKLARETELKAMIEQAYEENTRFEMQLQSTVQRYVIFLLK